MSTAKDSEGAKKAPQNTANVAPVSLDRTCPDLPETTRLCDLNEEEYAHFDQGLIHYADCTLCRASDEDPVSESEEGGEDEWRLRSCETTEVVALFSPINTIGEVWKRAEEQAEAETTENA